MLVPPPGRFSIRTCWSQLLESRSPTMRAITSVGPPAANGTTIRTGWVGQARAFARLAAMPDASADAAASALKQRRVIITMYLQLCWTGRRCIGVATISALNANRTGAKQADWVTEKTTKARASLSPLRPRHVQKERNVQAHFPRTFPRN